MAARSAIADLLSTKEMVIICGSGGTGKTTIAAALGVQAASVLGGKVLVLTVDPARRLATALGLADLAVSGNDAVRVPSDSLRDANGNDPRGELWMAMLDTKAGWDELIQRHAPSPALAEQVLANPLYRNITSRFVHSHDYIAMERLHELHSAGLYDLVIIDTPPSRNALDLLDAPRRMREFFGSRLLRWLTVPYRSRLFTVASQPFYTVADRVLGSRLLRDIAEFFMLFQTMEKGFVARANQVEQLLTDDRTTFIVVSTLDAAPAHEARYLVDELQRRRMPLGALVLNRTLPSSMRQPAARKAASELGAAAADVAFTQQVADTTPACTADDVAAVMSSVAEYFPDLAVLAGREAERRRELEVRVPLHVDVPLLSGDITDVQALLTIGHRLVAQ